MRVQRSISKTENLCSYLLHGLLKKKTGVEDSKTKPIKQEKAFRNIPMLASFPGLPLLGGGERGYTCATNFALAKIDFCSDCSSFFQGTSTDKLGVLPMTEFLFSHSLAELSTSRDSVLGSAMDKDDARW